MPGFGLGGAVSLERRALGVCEHGVAARRRGSGHFYLHHIPVLNQLAIHDAENIDCDRRLRSPADIAAVHHHQIAISRDHAGHIGRRPRDADIDGPHAPEGPESIFRNGSIRVFSSSLYASARIVSPVSVRCTPALRRQKSVCSKSDSSAWTSKRWTSGKAPVG